LLFQFGFGLAAVAAIMAAGSLIAAAALWMLPRRECAAALI
jgi:hypothetical protein